MPNLLIMEGISIIETATLKDLIFQLQDLKQTVSVALSDLKEKSKPYITSQELMDLTGFGKTWVNDNKALIGFTTVGSHLRFKRKDVEEYIEKNYYKLKTK